jgi:hypothetical protein
MLVAALTVFVSRRGLLLGLLMLTRGVVVGSLRVMERGVMVCGGLPVMLDRQVFVMFSLSRLPFHSMISLPVSHRAT